MKIYEVILQELVYWALLAFLFFMVLWPLLRSCHQRRNKKKVRKGQRKCAQCGLLQEMEPSEGKYGACEICGGVTVRGRSRKLG